MENVHYKDTGSYHKYNEIEYNGFNSLFLIYEAATHAHSTVNQINQRLLWGISSSRK